MRQSLERKRHDDPDFWSVVGIPEMSVYEALAAKNPAAQLPAMLPAIFAAYEDLHARAGTAWMWGSVFDQAGFVLKHFSGRSAAEAKAVKELLGVLRGYAGR